MTQKKDSKNKGGVKLYQETPNIPALTVQIYKILGMDDWDKCPKCKRESKIYHYPFYEDENLSEKVTLRSGELISSRDTANPESIPPRIIIDQHKKVKTKPYSMVCSNGHKWLFSDIRTAHDLDDEQWSKFTLDNSELFKLTPPITMPLNLKPLPERPWFKDEKDNTVLSAIRSIVQKTKEEITPPKNYFSIRRMINLIFKKRHKLYVTDAPFVWHQDGIGIEWPKGRIVSEQNYNIKAMLKHGLKCHRPSKKELYFLRHPEQKPKNEGYSERITFKIK